MCLLFVSISEVLLSGLSAGGGGLIHRVKYVLEKRRAYMQGAYTWGAYTWGAYRQRYTVFLSYFHVIGSLLEPCVPVYEHLLSTG